MMFIDVCKKGLRSILLHERIGIGVPLFSVLTEVLVD